RLEISATSRSAARPGATANRNTVYPRTSPGHSIRPIREMRTRPAGRVESAWAPAGCPPPADAPEPLAQVSTSPATEKSLRVSREPDPVPRPYRHPHHTHLGRQSRPPPG